MMMFFCPDVPAAQSLTAESENIKSPDFRALPVGHDNLSVCACVCESERGTRRTRLHCHYECIRSLSAGGRRALIFYELQECVDQTYRAYLTSVCAAVCVSVSE